MTKLKKAWMVFLLGAGVAAGSCYAAIDTPNPRTCFELAVKCNDGDFNACAYAHRIGCDI